jgi:hypothetical protein
VYIESNRDGTTGGSYYGLLEIVNHLDRSKYNPIIIFHDGKECVPPMVGQNRREQPESRSAASGGLQVLSNVESHPEE